MSNDYVVQTAQKPSPMAWQRYQPFAPVALPDRTWPDKVIDKAIADFHKKQQAAERQKAKALKEKEKARKEKAKAKKAAK